MFPTLTHTVVTDAAVRSTRGSEDLAGVTVLQLDDLVVNLHILDAGRRSLSGQDVPIGCFCKRWVETINLETSNRSTCTATEGALTGLKGISGSMTQ